ncbi:MAG: hypothetical protein IPK79_09685 [Vampirovibrionales bacterium]|nr:hypothetical protein [Vampirovibrionales bacterium]
MAKAINWPQAFRDEILAEDSEALRLALRPGSFYYDGGYWQADEEVDIRCHHARLRRAIIVGPLRTCAIADLSAEDCARLKTTLRTPEAIARFLEETYRQPQTLHSIVTIVTYRNLPVDPEQVEPDDDPSGRHV